MRTQTELCCWKTKSPTSSRPARAREGGMTLYELLVGIGVAGLLLLIGTGVYAFLLEDIRMQRTAETVTQIRAVTDRLHKKMRTFGPPGTDLTPALVAGTGHGLPKCFGNRICDAWGRPITVTANGSSYTVRLAPDNSRQACYYWSFMFDPLDETFIGVYADSGGLYEIQNGRYHPLFRREDGYCHSPPNAVGWEFTVSHMR